MKYFDLILVFNINTQQILMTKNLIYAVKDARKKTSN